jgi:hypothetical protein
MDWLLPFGAVRLHGKNAAYPDANELLSVREPLGGYLGLLNRRENPAGTLQSPRT